MEVESWVDIFSIIASAVIVLGVIVGGIWKIVAYVQERRRFPKANLSHKVQAIKLTDKKVCIHTSIRIQNIGNVMLHFESAKHTIYQILPPLDYMQERFESKEYLYDDQGREVNWTIVAEKEFEFAQHPLEIEPGEEDAINFDLLIPSDVEVIQVYTYFKNVKKRKREIGWSVSGIYNVEEIMKLGG